MPAELKYLDESWVQFTVEIWPVSSSLFLANIVK